MRTLIDGYNLMHAAGLVRGKLAGKQLEGARSRLLKRIGFHMTKDERANTIVVFDAKAAPVMASREEHLEGFRVLYPEPGHEADELIEDLIQQDREPRKLRIVSSDRRLHRAARERMAAAVASDRYLDELDERRVRRERDAGATARVAIAESRPAIPLPTPPTPSANPARPPRQTTPINEVDYWMKEFGAVTIPSQDEFEDHPLPQVAEPTPVSKPTPANKPVSTPAKLAGAIQPLPKPPATAARWTPTFDPTPTAPPPRRVMEADVAVSRPTEEDQQARELAFWQSEVDRVLKEERKPGG